MATGKDPFAFLDASLDYLPAVVEHADAPHRPLLQRQVWRDDQVRVGPLPVYQKGRLLHGSPKINWPLFARNLREQLPTVELHPQAQSIFPLALCVRICDIIQRTAFNIPVLPGI